MEYTYHLTDSKYDILSHPRRENKIYILTLDDALATDVYERLHNDPRMKNCELIRPQKAAIRQMHAEIEGMAQDTVSAKLLIIDVRRATLPMLQGTYNKVVGYNRRDINKLCYTILIGDGPGNLFQPGESLDVFVPHLAAHRIDYHPAVFFFDPFIHYEPKEIKLQRIDDEFVLPDKIPGRLVRYFKQGQDMRVDRIRRFFRATGKAEHIRRRRSRMLRRLYKKRIAAQFPHHKDQLRALLSKEGIRLTTEKMHLYPLFFEDWVYELVRKAGVASRLPPTEDLQE